MKHIGMWVGLGSVAALAACATPDEVSDVNRIAKSEATAGTPFTQALFQEYRDYANHESLVEGEWSDAAYYARKGFRAGAGEVVAPEELSHWKVPASRSADLAAARARLLGYFADGATDRVPGASAKAQVAFDCWVEEESEGDTASSCSSTFLALEPDLKKPMPVVQAIPERRHVLQHYVIHFGVNSTALSPDAEKTLHEVAASQAKVHAPRILVEGFTDTLGSAGRNMALSRQRADVVASELAKLGVGAAAIATAAEGETHLAVPTGANVNELRNRRVEVTLEGGPWSYGGWGYGGWGGGMNGYYHPASFAVFFDFGSSVLSPQAMDTLKQVVAAEKEMKPKHVTVEGYADGTGSPAANARISRERAETVAAGLKELGGGAASVSTHGFGAADGWRGMDAADARRVEVFFDFE